jgi:hypothetical protein
MKSRARRVTIAAAVLGAGVIAVLVVTHWGTVRDHCEAWRVQLAKYTEMIEPNVELRGRPTDLRRELWVEHGVHGIDLELLVECLANSSGLPVVFVPLRYETIIGANDRHLLSFVYPFELAGRLEKTTAASARTTLEAFGFRVLEQRFPRRAYVVIGEKDAIDGSHGFQLGEDP